MMLTAGQPAFTVRDIPVFGDLILAPMDGISDLPFRTLTRRLGSAMSYTEFINARDVLEGHPHLSRRLEYEEFERPVVFQIFDDDPERMLKAAESLMAYNPDILDVNLGCSAKTVVNRGAGAALLRDPHRIARIFANLSSALPLPVTAKIRLGWDGHSLNFLEVARIIEDNGGQLIAVHGRTKQQAYSGEADWDAIAQVKQAVKVPVIANGDVRNVQDIEAIKLKTGCDGIMIGRAAIGNPWLFARRNIEDVPSTEVITVLEELLRSMLTYYGDERGVLLFRKFSKRILSAIETTPSEIQNIITDINARQVFEKLHDLKYVISN